MRYFIPTLFLLLPVLTLNNEQPLFKKDKLAFHLKPATFPDLFKTNTAKKSTAIDTTALKQTSWYAEAMKNIVASEYEIKYDTATKSYLSPNRKNNLRAFYKGNTFSLSPQNGKAGKWNLTLKLKGIYNGNNKIYSPAINPVITNNKNDVRFNNSNEFITEYINSEEGVRQNFIISQQPLHDPGNLSVQLEASKEWFVNKVHDREIHFAKATKNGFDKKITYNGLKAWDANNKELEASFAVNDNDININVKTAGAVYPVTIDPLSTGTLGTPDWIGDDANQNFSQYGVSVASAGDVNGDGYSDVIIGADNYLVGINFSGQAFVYYGSATGLSATPNSTLANGVQNSALFAESVASAGDVNGDGYSDVIIGAPYYDDGGNADEGRAFIYYGSSSGLSTTPNSTPDDADQAGAHFGWSVASAGDVNGDGYSDVIIGAYTYQDGANQSEGRAYVYYGSASGVSATPNNTFGDANQGFAYFGTSVASAGDINGDGYSDVIIGAPSYDDGANTDEGRAFVYYGSASGLSATPNSTPDDADQASASFGNSVASAGDVNGDGYSDVIIGAHYYNDAGNVQEGRAFVYYGSSTGLSATPNSILDDADQAGARFGESVASAGDVNGDGYSDVIVGAFIYADGGNTQEGRAFVYYGSATGLAASPNSTPDDADEATAWFGESVASAGDVNGDGYSDVIIGAPKYSSGTFTQDGRAFVYYGTASGLSTASSATLENNQGSSQMGWSVASAGDVNADGYSDVIVGAPFFDNVQTDEGAAFVFHGSATGLSPVIAAQLEINQAGAEFGFSVASAGDVNGDGYGDVIVGAIFYSNLESAEGGAFIFHGSAAGIITTIAQQLESNQPNATFGRSVSSAGDVNGDGYGDVIVGANFFTNGEANEGAAFVYLGSATGITNTIASQLECNFANSSFGRSVACAGDVNGDGYSDVIVGASTFTNVQAGEGAAFVFHGGPLGISTTIQAQLEMNVASAQMGVSVSGAGDVNGDGYSDVIVGANTYSNPQANEGAAFVYLGSATGINPVVATQLESNQASGQMGYSVASAGDVNGDGYSDIIIGAYTFTNGQAGEGVAYVYHGSPAGIVTATSTLLEKNQASANFGVSVACAGDVNGDGYSDIIVGAYFYNNGTPLEGAAFVYLGNNGGGKQNNLRLYNTDLVTPIQRSNILVPNLFGAGLFARSSLGRVKGKLVWETKKQGLPFSGNPITNSTSFLGKSIFTDLGIAGTELKSNVQKLDFQNKVRVRVEYDKVTAITGQVYGPWRYPAGYLQGAQGMNSLPLPVVLLTFNASAVNDNDVLVNWVVASETNMKNYVVERSTDGINFVAAGNVAAAAINGTQHEYNFTDIKGLSGSTIIYYRLQLIDNNGKISYAKTVTVTNKKQLSSYVYPNPVIKGTNAVLSVWSVQNNLPLTIDVIDAAGKKLMQQYVTLQSGKNEFTISTNKLSSGIYFIFVNAGVDKKQYKLVVQ